MRTASSKPRSTTAHGKTSPNRNELDLYLQLTTLHGLNSYSVCLTRLPKQFKRVILQTTVKYGSESDWFDLYEMAKSTKSDTDKVLYLNALTYTQNYNLLKL